MKDEKLGKSERCVIGISSSLSACSVPDYAEISILQHIVYGENIDSKKNEIE